jgi:predicted enzyme related to lactoylglutathione lyase
MSKSATTVTGLRFALIYVDQLAPAKAFYEKYLGFEQTQEFRPGEIYGKAGNIEMWIGEGYNRLDNDAKSTRATVMLGVESTGALFEALQAGGEKVVQDAPVEMQDGIFWLQFADPSGNIVEVLGGK